MKKITLLVISLFFALCVNAQQWESTYGPMTNSIIGITEFNNALFLATEWGNYKSTDGGNNWSDVNLPNSGGSSSFCAIGNKIFFKNYFSSDGNNWNLMANLSSSIIKYATDGQNIFALDDCCFGPYYSADNGNTWKNIKWNLPSIGNLYSGMAVLNNRVYVSVESNGIFYSSLSDSTWHPVNSGLPSIQTWDLETDGINLYTGVYSSGIYSFSQQQNSWHSINDTNTAHTDIQTIYINGNNIYIGVRNGIFKSTLNSSSWSVINTSAVTDNNGYYFPLAFLEKDTALYVGFDYNGLRRTFDQGQNWTLLHNGIYAGQEIDQIATSNGALWSARYPSHRMYRSTDHGSDWNPLHFNYALWYPICNFTSFFAEGSDIYYGQQDGKIYFSHDTGVTWTESNTTSTSVNAFASFNGVIYLLDNGQLYKSLDKGINWVLVNINLSIYEKINAIISYNNEIYIGIYNATGSGTIYKSMDGINWNLISTLSNKGVMKFTSSGNNLYMLTYNNTGIFVSNDNGFTWAELNYSGLPGFIEDIIAADNNLYATIQSYDPYGSPIYYGIYKFENNSWSSFNQGLKELDIHCLAYDGTYLYAGVSYDGVYRIPSSTATGINDFFLSFSDINIFPNPSSGIFTINFKNKTADTKICVYDVLGNCVLNKVYGNEVNTKMNLSSQPKGIYFVQIVVDGKRAVKKIILN